MTTNNINRNDLFTVICENLGVKAKFEKSGTGTRPSVSTDSKLAGAYAHLLCNPKNIPLVNALIDKGIDGVWFSAPKKYGENATYRAFLYGCGTSVRDIRGTLQHVSADSITGKVDQAADWLAWCQAEACKLCVSKALGLAQSIREGRINSNLPEQVKKASIQLAMHDKLEKRTAPKTVPANHSIKLID